MYVASERGPSTSHASASRYFTSSLVNKIFAYDYDLESGAVSNRREFIEGKALNLPANSFCDGLCIDSEGCIWSARFVTLLTSGT
jgi:sugar lactone lactonase YvrE